MPQIKRKIKTMKTIKLKIKKEKVANREMFFSFYELLKIAINNTPQQGYSVEEMQKRLRILKELETYKEQFDIEEGKFNDSMLDREAELKLEDSDFDKLKELVKECKWGVLAQSIIELSEEFEEKK
jgi:hypothetical protein